MVEAYGQCYYYYVLSKTIVFENEAFVHLQIGFLFNEAALHAFSELKAWQTRKHLSKHFLYHHSFPVAYMGKHY